MKKAPPALTRRTSEGDAPPASLTTTSASAPIGTPGAVPPRIAAAPRRRHGGIGVGRRTRTSDLPHGAVTRSETPRTPLRSMSDVALGASIRAAATRAAGQKIRLHPQDLRRKIRAARTPNLILFLVDGSGSMMARKRMSAVKGAILSLLLDAYQKRDTIGMIVFRGTDAEVVLPPTRSVLQARQRLEGLATGGLTPLATGLEAAFALLKEATRRYSDYLPLLVVLTDGRGNVSLQRRPTAVKALSEAYGVARQIAHEGWSSVVIDCESSGSKIRLAAPLAEALRGGCIELESISADTLTRVLKPYIKQ